MNKPQVLFHLRAARLQLDDMVKDIEADDAHDGFPEFYALLPFVYRNLNRAWNSRDKTGDEMFNMSREESEKFCRFPDDLSPSISD
jgi:hypothetical protein